ncbi:MAG: Sphingolipid ceramide N-deacylase, partial [Frankiales bacterium]|nr:Sphingolipid ceramide N-deacylase [Frankiales bacterium]
MPATLRSLLAVTTLALTAAGAGALAAPPKAAAPTAAKVPYRLVVDRDVDDRLPQPEDRYALAGGCYLLEAPGQGFVSRRDGALTLAASRSQALPLHFQATKLGEYLLATDEGAETRFPGADWDVRHYVTGADAAPAVAQEPSKDAEWRVVAAGGTPDRKKQGQQYVLSAGGQSLTAAGRALAMGPKGSGFTVRSVPAGDPLAGSCARWPEIETGASGKPKPVTGSAAGRAQGFFEAHVHGMAFEFLGGELRCGRPWHPYGVEYALGNCQEDGKLFNSALEVGLAGQSPTDPVAAYDPVGWPTFGYWPQSDTLTHEQYYWRWLERAYLGGLRMTTNLLVDNTALCQAFPKKKNSCNEMDGVRLQAKRMFELQDYVDAQSGGPGEGWYRIVTTPAQARQTINAGRLAVVMGIEVSSLFDCGEMLDVPQCTTAQIDRRLQEVYDMGVRQMELLNKFDSALAGVTGDGGSTGLVVNNGNKQVTGHFWDMRTCVEPAGTHTHEHDKTQSNVGDDVPDGGQAEVDVLAGRVLEQFGPLSKGIVAPVYPKGPHCNSRGLTPLGAHVVAKMIEKGMVFDPDHMSALAQRQALDLVEKKIVPAEAQAAKKTGRPAVQPALISSHSWGNDAIYQRIYGLDGVVAPRTGDASTFVDRWAQHRQFAADNAPAGYDFGMGYGADTNGLGGQPGPRDKPARKLDYSKPIQAPIGGVTLRQQKSGVKTYDISRDGVAHYGLFADWFAELRLAADERQKALGGGDAIVADMLDGAETYLRIWERGTYGGGGSCVHDGSTLQVEDLHALLGGNLEGFLDAAGAPVSREDDAYVYCAQDDEGHAQVVEVAFDAAGKAVSLRKAPAALVQRLALTTKDTHTHAAGHAHAAVGAAAGAA